MGAIENRQARTAKASVRKPGNFKPAYPGPEATRVPPRDEEPVSTVVTADTAEVESTPAVKQPKEPKPGKATRQAAQAAPASPTLPTTEEATAPGSLAAASEL